MKTTIEISSTTFRRAKTLAAAKGITLKQLVTEAIEEKLQNGSKRAKTEEPAWMKLYGAFAKSGKMRRETRRIQKLIDREFERIKPEDWR